MRSMQRVGHAYLYEGKALLQANAFAKALNCLEGAHEACGRCISCRVFDSGNHPDTFYISGTKETSIGVDDVREQVIIPMATGPFSYKYKVFIIDKAETLTPNAQNALLKTIEEPAPYGVFLLLCSQLELMLETVRSRCVIRKIPAETAQTDAAMRALVTEVVQEGYTLDILGALALYKKFEPFKESKELSRLLLDTLYEAYGEGLRAGGGTRAIRAAKAITHTKEILSHNGNYQLAIELMLLRIGAHVA